MRETSFESCSYFKTSATENQRGKSPEIIDTEDVIGNIIHNFENSNDYINSLSIIRRQQKMYNHLKITKDFTGNQEKANKTVRLREVVLNNYNI